MDIYPAICHSRILGSPTCTGASEPPLVSMMRFPMWNMWRCTEYGRLRGVVVSPRFRLRLFGGRAGVVGLHIGFGLVLVLPLPPCGACVSRFAMCFGGGSLVFACRSPIAAPSLMLRSCAPASASLCPRGRGGKFCGAVVGSNCVASASVLPQPPVGRRAEPCQTKKNTSAPPPQRRSKTTDLRSTSRCKQRFSTSHPLGFARPAPRGPIGFAPRCAPDVSRPTCFAVPARPSHV